MTTLMQPPTPSDPSTARRRRRVLTAAGGVLAAGAAVAVAVALGGSGAVAASPTSAPATTASTTAAGTDVSSAVPAAATSPVAADPAPSAAPVASADTVAAAFTAATHDTRSRVVAVPGGYEGADAGGGTLRFWSWDGSAWQVVGTSSYPADLRGDDEVRYSATVADAALLTGMQHATFQVRDEGLTGDGSADTEFFTAGPSGWGAVEAADGALHPTGAPVDPADQNGLWAGGALFEGYLVTAACQLDVVPGLGDCTSPSYQTRSVWAWDGTEFVAHPAVNPQG